MKLFGISEQLRKQLVGKTDRLSEQECAELFMLLQLTINGVKDDQERTDVVDAIDKL